MRCVLVLLLTLTITGVLSQRRRLRVNHHHHHYLHHGAGRFRPRSYPPRPNPPPPPGVGTAGTLLGIAAITSALTRPYYPPVVYNPAYPYYPYQPYRPWIAYKRNTEEPTRSHLNSGSSPKTRILSSLTNPSNAYYRDQPNNSRISRIDKTPL
ncbi:hypothetical protein RB195_013592 [Necator americanus]|uniref:Uncharacterized protein n=1 Tax=Necator americanus TaxID=51031 RepID=A0ABR1DXV5_NECAM